MTTRLVVALVLALLALAGGAASHAQVAPVIDPCPQMWSVERGAYGGCFQFMPAVVVCDGCMSAWPVWPDGGAQ